MTTHAINCGGFSDRLMAYLEHETDDATRMAVERHAASCDDCGALLADLRRLPVDASNLPELTPSRDLWSGIAARIEAPVVSIGTVQRGKSVAFRRRGWMRGALIAASLVAAAGVGYLAAVKRAQQPGRDLASIIQPMETVTVASAPETTFVSASPSGVAAAPEATTIVRPASTVLATPAKAQVAVATLSADYDREIARLRTLIEQRRNQLDPITVAIIERNLQVIDAAIVECKKAIIRDPASRFLIESLNQSLQTKVELMRTAALLPSRT
jgi:anti-sigma factor RsiW